MSGTENVSLGTPQLSPEDFDKLFEAEQKRLGGDESAHKALGRGGYPEPQALEQAAPEPVEAEEEATVVATEETPPTESSTETDTSATEGADSTTTETTATTEQQENALAWLESLDPAVKAKVEEALAEKARLEHKLKSDEGRVAAYQRHYDQARQELEALKKGSRTSPPAEKPAATAAKPKEIPANIKAILDTDETLGKALLETHEELERRNDALEQKLRALEEQTINPLRETQERIYLQQELDLLEREMPGAKEVLGHDIWDDFKSVAPPWLKELAESSERKKVATALQEYQRWIADPAVQQWAASKYGVAEQKQEPKAETKPAARQPDPQAVAKAEAVKAAAERKAAASPVASTTVGRPATKKRTLDDIINSGDKAELDRWHRQEFENECARLEGRKPVQIT